MLVSGRALANITAVAAGTPGLFSGCAGAFATVGVAGGVLPGIGTPRCRSEPFGDKTERAAGAFVGIGSILSVSSSIC